MLESLHPGGPGVGVRVIGHGAAAGLIGATRESEAGLVVLSPTRSERRDDQWRAAAVAEIRSMSPRPMVLLASPDRALRRLLARGGLRPGPWILHVPDIGRTRLLAPAGSPAARFALARVMAAGPVKSAATRALPGIVLGALGRATQVYAWPGAALPFAWLSQLGHPASSPCAMATTSGRPHAATVLLRFDAAPEPDLVAKVGGRAAEETEALRRLGGGAREAGARVPSVTWAGERNNVAVLAMSALAGDSWAHRVHAEPGRVPELLSRLARWLDRWNAASAEPTPLTADHLESFLLAPAARVCAAANLPAHFERLRQLCERCQGHVVPLVSAHNDLTAANLLLADGDLLSVIDWEEAAPACLPLGDLAYGAVDIVAAVDGYRDRAAAFASCFGAAGQHFELTRRHMNAQARALDLAPETVELCLHACWIGHAANELSRDADSEPRPFAAIIADIGARPSLWGKG